MVLGASHVLDALQRALAITAFGSLAGLVDSLLLQLPTRSADGTSFVLLSVVGMTSYSGPTGIRHCCYWGISKRNERLQSDGIGASKDGCEDAVLDQSFQDDIGKTSRQTDMDTVSCSFLLSAFTLSQAAAIIVLPDFCYTVTTLVARSNKHSAVADVACMMCREGVSMVMKDTRM